MSKEFQDLPPQVREAVRNAPDSAAPMRSVEEVKAMLDTTEKGGVRNSIRNCLTVFQYDPLLAGALPARLGALALGGVGMSLIFLLAAWPLGLGEELKAALARPKPPEPHEKNSKTRRTRKISGHRGGKRV